MTNTTAPGWYPDGQGGTRWWDGRGWTEHTQAPVVPQGRQPISETERAAILNGEVAKWARAGWSVQSVMAGQAILQRNTRIGLFWNVLLSIVTAGIWLIVVAYRALNRKQQTMVISVDAYGKLNRR